MGDELGAGAVPRVVPTHTVPLPAPLRAAPEAAAEPEGLEVVLAARADALAASLRGGHVTRAVGRAREERGLDVGRRVAHVARRQNAETVDVDASHEEPPLLAATERTAAI